MKNQALFSLKDTNKTLKCRLLQFLFCALRINDIFCTKVGGKLLKICSFLFQLIILMALAKGKSSIRCGPVTLHTETAIHVAKQLTDVSIALYTC